MLTKVEMKKCMCSLYYFIQQLFINFKIISLRLYTLSFWSPCDQVMQEVYDLLLHEDIKRKVFKWHCWRLPEVTIPRSNG